MALGLLSLEVLPWQGRLGCFHGDFTLGQLLPSGPVSPSVLLGFVQPAAEKAVIRGGIPEAVRLRQLWP